jgi:hypothetical protein
MEQEEESIDSDDEEDADEEHARSPFPLAYDVNGNPLELPPQAVAWRVRRGGGRRGRPRHVFDRESGRQLEIPLAGSLDNLLDAGCPPDRYLLYPIDGAGRVIEGILAVTEVPEGAIEDDGGGAKQPATIEQSVMLATIREQGMTIRHQADCLTRSLEATTAGYGRVRPMEAPPPVIVEQAPAEAPGGGFKPEQIAEFMGIARQFIEMFRGGAGGGAPGGGGGP